MFACANLSREALWFSVSISFTAGTWHLNPASLRRRLEVEGWHWMAKSHVTSMEVDNRFLVAASTSNASSSTEVTRGLPDLGLVRTLPSSSNRRSQS